MKFNNLILLGSFLLLVLLLGIGVATANENNTIESVELDVGQDLSDSNESLNSNDSAEEYNAVIIAKNSTQKYNGDNEVAVKIVDNENKIINNAKVRINDCITPTYDDGGIYYFYFDLNPGNHSLKITLDDSHHKAKPVFINLKIVKSKFTGKIKCKSYWGTNKGKVTMKATAYNDELFYNENGQFTFKVNGKSYKVKTKNGVATKTIRIKKAGTFTYTAKFTSDKYSSSPTGKGKLYVYSTSKKARTFKIGKYKIVLSLAQMKNWFDAINLDENAKSGVYHDGAKFVGGLIVYGNDGIGGTLKKYTGKTFKQKVGVGFKGYKDLIIKMPKKIKSYKKADKWADNYIKKVKKIRGKVGYINIYKKKGIYFLAWYKPTFKKFKTVNAKVYIVLNYGICRYPAQNGAYNMFLTTNYQLNGHTFLGTYLENHYRESKSLMGLKK